MRVAASYLGLVGGMVGLFWAAGILTLCPGSCPPDLQGGGMDALLWGAFAAYLLSIAGAGGWIISHTRPDVGGWLMVVSGAGNLVADTPLFLVPGILLVIGGGITLAVGGAERGQAQMAEVRVAEGPRNIAREQGGGR